MVKWERGRESRFQMEGTECTGGKRYQGVFKTLGLTGSVFLVHFYFIIFILDQWFSTGGRQLAMFGDIFLLSQLVGGGGGDATGI